MKAPKPHHAHIFATPPGLYFGGGLMFYGGGPLRLFCYSEDCYSGLDREMYPPEKIGPKVELKDMPGEGAAKGPGGA